MVITFCGHSDFQETGNLKALLVDKLTAFARNCDELLCYCGGYGNFDYFAYKCVNLAKKQCSNIKNIFVSPYLNEQYIKNIAEHQNFDSIIYPELEHMPLKFAILHRNKWMIDNCDILIGFVKHNWGEAAKTLAYARSKRKQIILL